MKKALSLISFLILVLLLNSCNRSSFFRRDEDSFSSNSEAFSMGDDENAKKLDISAVQPKKKVFIFGFWNNTPVNQSNFGAYAADELRRGLYLSHRVILSEDMKSDFSTDDFVHGDTVQVGRLIREGQKLGVTVVVIGRISRILFRQHGEEIGLFRQKQSLAFAELEVKIFDIQAGREIAAISQKGESTSKTFLTFDNGSSDSENQRVEITHQAIQEAIANLLPEVIKAVDKITWQGRIARVNGSKIYVNAGRSSGLILGDILKVLTTGEEIYDPLSGGYLGRSEGQLKGTLEVTEFIGIDGSVSKIHTGGNFHEGDFVQLY